VVKDVKCPLNILAGPGAPSAPELQRLGVARVSVGSGAMRATLGLVKRIAEELKSSGTYAAMEGGIPHADVNRMLS
jgi:2-methylisocitrate lyase-like PEP mutase family enzyme